MRPLNRTVHSRTRVEQRWALMPLEGFPTSRLPTWPGAASIFVLAAPALGAAFVQYLIELPAGESGGFPADAALETFIYNLSGSGTVNNFQLTPGGYALLPPGQSVSAQATDTMRLLILRKKFEALPPAQSGQATAPPFQPLYGNQSQVEPKIWADDPGALLQTLVPDDLTYDLAINIFQFQPGHGLPIIETHVMEHGALILQGKGLYYLGNEWMEIETDDFIWMGPYCPQSFYATGALPAKYIYYKNVNRDIPLK